MAQWKSGDFQRAIFLYRLLSGWALVGISGQGCSMAHWQCGDRLYNWIRSILPTPRQVMGLFLYLCHRRESFILTNIFILTDCDNLNCWLRSATTPAYISWAPPLRPSERSCRRTVHPDLSNMTQAEGTQWHGVICPSDSPLHSWFRTLSPFDYSRTSQADPSVCRRKHSQPKLKPWSRVWFGFEALAQGRQTWSRSTSLRSTNLTSHYLEHPTQRVRQRCKHCVSNSTSTLHLPSSKVWAAPKKSLPPEFWGFLPHCNIKISYIFKKYIIL